MVKKKSKRKTSSTSTRQRVRQRREARQQRRRLGLPGTSSFLVNDQRLVGPPSYEVLQTTIESLLAGEG